MTLFNISDDWRRDEPMPVNTVLEECYVSRDGTIKYQGLFYTGLLLIRMAGGINVNLVDYGKRERNGFIPDFWNDTHYWRHTGISKESL